MTGRARDYRGGSAWFKAWLLRMQRDRHGAMPQSWWRGRAEKRRGPEDDAFRLIAHGRPGENDMLSCIPYVCMRSRDVLNSSIYLILSSSMDLGASGRLSRAFKQCRKFPSDPLVLYPIPYKVQYPGPRRVAGRVASGVARRGCVATVLTTLCARRRAPGRRRAGLPHGASW